MRRYHKWTQAKSKNDVPKGHRKPGTFHQMISDDCFIRLLDILNHLETGNCANHRFLDSSAFLKYLRLLSKNERTTKKCINALWHQEQIRSFPFWTVLSQCEREPKANESANVAILTLYIISASRSLSYFFHIPPCSTSSGQVWYFAFSLLKFSCLASIVVNLPAFRLRKPLSPQLPTLVPVDAATLNSRCTP